LQQRTDIFADFISMIKISQTMTESRFLYVMQPIDCEDENGDWTGSIDALKRIFKKDTSDVKLSVETLTQKVHQL
jgi:transcription elongation factor GreA-like protein